MNPIVIFSVCLVLTTFSACSGRPAESQPVGKYTVSKSNNDDDGKYRPVQRNEGRYIHMTQPYVHIHDNRELGQYVHIPNPYDGGYGPYAGLNNPYRHDESGNYDKYTVSNADFEIPAIRLEYGFPDHDPEGVNKMKTCDLSSPKVSDRPIIKISEKPVIKPIEKPVIKVFEKSVNVVSEKPVIVSEKPVMMVNDDVEKPIEVSDEEPVNDVKKPVIDIEKPVNDDIETETEKDIEI